MRPAIAWLRSAVMNVARLANYDFCPWANRYVYWLRKPIGWFVIGAAAAALVAVFLAPQAWIIFSSLVVVILMGVVWPCVTIRGTIPSLEFDRRRCSEMVSTQVKLSVENRWPWPVWGLTLEGLDDSSQPVASLARVPGWSRSEFHFAFRPGRRGVYPATAPRAATGFPFGIFSSHRLVAVDRALVVWPHAARLKSVPTLSGTIPHVLGMRLDRVSCLHTAIVMRSDAPLACSAEYCLRSDQPCVLLGCRRGAFPEFSIVRRCSQETNVW